MRVMFDKELRFLKEQCNIDLPSRSCFYDKMAIYAYNQFYFLMPLYRLEIVNGVLKVKKVYDFYGEPIAWDEVIEFNRKRLLDLEKESLDTIKAFLNEYKDHEKLILTSGGKDSSVTMHLVRKILPDCIGRFDNVSLDVADTYLHIKTLSNVEISNPDKGFYQWREENNFIPTRFARACCSIFKEGKLMEDIPSDKKMLFFMGMRNDESDNRSSYEDKWINEKWGNRDWLACLPIRKWKELDIWLYILMNEIPVNPKYEKGYSRAGCSIACPFAQGYTWVLDRYWYKYLYQRWHDILENDFVENRKWTRLNCTIKEYHNNWNGGLVREVPTKEVIEEFAKYMNLDISIAGKYFNNECDCKKKIKSDDVGLSMKYLGRNTKKVFCKKCLSKFLGISIEDLNKSIGEFKLQGCSLF